MVEGKAQRVTDRATLERVAAAWATKWNGQWQFEAAEGGSPRWRRRRWPVLTCCGEAHKILAFGKGAFSHPLPAELNGACLQVSALSTWPCLLYCSRASLGAAVTSVVLPVWILAASSKPAGWPRWKPSPWIAPHSRSAPGSGSRGPACSRGGGFDILDEAGVLELACGDVDAHRQPGRFRRSDRQRASARTPHAPPSGRAGG